ncbi:MAG: hypothetical protein M3176_02370 [Chloroflexota bacterium]|nr:hypothetical protein [Chloroflexota bacterium]
MKVLQRDAQGVKRGKNHQGVELLLFLVVSALGIYALGNGLRGLLEPGKALLWLAIAGIAMMILFAQMGRVHDRWPRRTPQHRRARSVAPDARSDGPRGRNEERDGRDG